MVVYNPLARSVLIVAVTWWVLMTGWAVWEYRALFFSFQGFSAALSYLVWAMVAVVCGLGIGLAGVIAAEVTQRMLRLRELRQSGRLGMLCSLGGMPIPPHPGLNLTLDTIPAWYASDAEHGPALLHWIHQNEESHPVHARAMNALVRVFCAQRTLPASHVPGGHGNKTLIDHSSRVAARMLEEAHNFRYEGLVTKYGREPFGDAAYQFDRLDPMVPLIGLAHDIGKLHTFKVDAAGKVISTAPKHDLVGSRMLSTMDEIKALPFADQRVMHLAISHYHHPSDYPLDEGGRLASDRAVALMMLLIRCDKWAGKEEAGRALSPDQYAAYLRYVSELGQELSDEEEQAMNRPPTTPSSSASTAGAPGQASQGSSVIITDERVRSAVLSIILNPAAVCQAMPKGNARPIGQVCNTSYPDWAWQILHDGVALTVEDQQRVSQYVERLVVIHEQRFRQALAKALGLSEIKQLGDKRAAITVHALRVLHDLGVLYTDSERGSVSPESALFKVQIQRNDDGRELAKWTAILLRPVGSLAQLATGGLHPSLVKVLGPLWADRIKSTASGVTDVTGTGASTQEYALDAAQMEEEPDEVLGEPGEPAEPGADMQGMDAMEGMKLGSEPDPGPKEEQLDLPGIMATELTTIEPSTADDDVPPVVETSDWKMPPPLPDEVVHKARNGRELVTASQANAASEHLMAGAETKPTASKPASKHEEFERLKKDRKNSLTNRGRWGEQK